MLRLSLLLVPAFVLAACADVGDAPVAETTTLTDTAATAAAPSFTGTALPLDTTASSIGWHAAKVTRTHDGGFQRFDGALYVDGETVTGVDVTIDAASIYSDSERLTGHLKSEDFFDVALYPTARFTATTFEPIPEADSAEWADATHQVTGTLTMRGQTRQLTFPARITVGAGSITADADFIINRQEWGLSYPGAPDDLIRDKVQILLHAVAPRAAATEPDVTERNEAQP